MKHQGYFMNRILILIVLLFPITDYSKERPLSDKDICAKNLAGKILKNKPSIKKEKLENLVYNLLELKEKYKIDLFVYSAILMQESSYNLKAISETGDYGISQINIENIRKMKLDKIKLTTDLKYSLEAGAIILGNFKIQYEKKEKDYWTRYNSSNSKKRALYKKLVKRFM